MIALVAVPVAAWAAERGSYRGQTARGGLVSFRVNGDAVQRMTFGPHRVRCEDGRRLRFRVPTDGDSLRITDDRFRVSVFAREGAVVAAGDGRFVGRRARGTVQIVAIVDAAGRPDPSGENTTWCQSRELRWSARRR